MCMGRADTRPTTILFYSTRFFLCLIPFAPLIFLIAETTKLVLQIIYMNKIIHVNEQFPSSETFFKWGCLSLTYKTLITKLSELRMWNFCKDIGHTSWFQASAVMLMRSALFWDITRCCVVTVYRRYMTTYWSHLHGSRRKKIWDQYVVLKHW